MRKVPGEPHCYIRAGAGEVAVTEVTPLLFIVITTGLGVSLSLSGVLHLHLQLTTVNTSLSQSRWVEVGENVVVQPRQQDLAAGVIEATVATTLTILAHHAE